MKAKVNGGIKESKLDPEMRRKLGERIKQLRLEAGFSSYEHFANTKDISRAQFGRYENGEDMRFSSLVKIVKAFDLTLEEFFSKGF